MRAAFIALALALSGCASDPFGDMLSRHEAVGNLRTDRTPADAPFDANALAEDFRAIALRTEVETGLQKTLHEPVKPIDLMRWGRTDLTWRMRNGTESDAAELHDLLARVETLTPLRFAQTADATTSLKIHMISPQERRAYRSRAVSEGKTRQRRDMLEWMDSDRSPCMVITRRNKGGSEITAARIFIKAEIKGLLRRTCLHEETIQGLGLMNDSPAARPSIFNDDQEFALLTFHDEMLLKILYDPRLEPGMTEDEAMPIVRRIAAELEL